MGVTRQGIVIAAVQILDEYGLADLSMRRIADQLGVKAATIYWHYENKQTLLAGVSDSVLAAQAEVPAAGLVPALRWWAHDLRTVLLAHRDAAELIAATLAVGLGQRIPDAAASQIFRAAGWPEADADRAARAMTHFVLGHVMQEQTRRNLISVGVLAGSVHDLDEEGFDLGLELLVRGAEQLNLAWSQSAR